MKALTFSLLALGLVLSSHAKADDLSSKFQVSCRIELIGLTAATKTIAMKSPALTLPEGPSVLVQLGGYTLAAEGSYTGTTTANLEPRLEVAIFEDGKGPIVGQKNLAGATGLKNAKLGQTVSVYSRSFLNMTYEDAPFTRVDYSCSMVRTK